jgi:hypothetical protein
MPLAGPGKFNDALGDDSVRKIICEAKAMIYGPKNDGTYVVDSFQVT